MEGNVHNSSLKIKEWSISGWIPVLDTKNEGAFRGVQRRVFEE